jgi:hypothetical protein
MKNVLWFSNHKMCFLCDKSIPTNNYLDVCQNVTTLAGKIDNIKTMGVFDNNNIREIAVKDVEGITVDNCENLEKIIVDNFTVNLDVSNCPNLREIVVEENNTLRYLELYKLPKLEKLPENCYALETLDISCLPPQKIPAYPNIDKLRIAWTNTEFPENIDIWHLSIKKSVLEKFPNIYVHNLSLDDVKINQPIPALKNLYSLEIADGNLSALPVFPSLEIASFRNCTGNIPDFPKTTHLTFENCPEVIVPYKDGQKVLFVYFP